MKLVLLHFTCTFVLQERHLNSPNTISWQTTQTFDVPTDGWTSEVSIASSSVEWAESISVFVFTSMLARSNKCSSVSTLEMSSSGNILMMSDEGYFRDASCVLNLISMIFMLVFEQILGRCAVFRFSCLQVYWVQTSNLLTVVFNSKTDVMHEV